MGLDDLVSCIELLQQRTKSHGTVLREYETRTRMALIDPLLDALGWDTDDPSVVIPEYKVSDGWADYALLRPDGHPAAVIEAKKLGTMLDAKSRRQMLNYANESGIEYAGLTDGNNWELYKVFQPGPLEERQKLNVSIVADPAHASALRLLTMWRPNLASGKPIPATEPILKVCDKPRVIKVAPPEPDWVALSEYNPPPGTSCPGAIRFWDGKQQKLNYWNQVLTSVAKKLYAENSLSVEDLPLRRTPTSETCIVNTEPTHPNGKMFGNTKGRIEGKPALFVCLDLDARQARQNAKWLLKRYDQDPANIYLHIAR